MEIRALTLSQFGVNTLMEWTIARRRAAGAPVECTLCVTEYVAVRGNSVRATPSGQIRDACLRKLCTIAQVV